MSARRWNFGAAVLGECIYAVGGFSRGRFLDSGERYCASTGNWSAIAGIDVRRAGFGMASKRIG